MADGCGCKKVDGKCSNWKKNIKNICKQLDIYIEFVYDHEEEFLKQFAVSGCDLVNIYFSTDRIKINYIITSGMHITDAIDIDDFVIWMESVNSSSILDNIKDLEPEYSKTVDENFWDLI